MTGFGHTMSAPALPEGLPVEWQTCAVCGLCNQFKVGVGARCWPEAVCGGEARWSDQHCRCDITWSPALEHCEAVADHWGVEPSAALWAVWDPVLPPNRVRNGCDFGLDEDRFVDRRLAGGLSCPAVGELISWEKTGGQPPKVETADGLWRATVYGWGTFYRNDRKVRTGAEAFERKPWAIDHAEQSGFADQWAAAAWAAVRVTPPGPA